MLPPIAEQTRRHTVSIGIEPVRKRKPGTATELQRWDGRNDSLEIEVGEYLKKENNKTCKKTNGQPLSSGSSLKAACI